MLFPRLSIHRLLGVLCSVYLAIANSSYAVPPTNLTPPNLMPMIGPVVAPQPTTPGHINTYNSRYTANEQNYFTAFLPFEFDPAGGDLTYNHYGALRSRLAWALRNGEPIGAAANNENLHAYARGRRMLKSYLAYSKRNKYATASQHNTSMADMEAYYVLEGDVDAYNHIWVTASDASYNAYNYYSGGNAKTDARIITEAMQAYMAAQRMGIPFAHPPSSVNGGVGFDATPGSWKNAGKRQIGWINTNWVRSDGSIPSPSHGGDEAFLFNGWLTMELLNWYGYIEQDPAVLTLAKKIFDHLIDHYNLIDAPKGWSCLPYVTSSTYAATDLAAIYIAPALSLWQITGQQKYYDFAVTHHKAANTAYVSAVKQWNQTYNTRGYTAEALMAGVPWAPVTPPQIDTVPPSAPTNFR